jgi:hypothetical protein
LYDSRHGARPDFSRGRCVTAPPQQRGWWTSSLPAEREAAARTCLACPVLDACREYALTLPESDPAVYAGMSAHERHQRKRALLKQAG